MTEKTADRPEVMHVEITDLMSALALGWRDFRTAPLYGFAFSLVFVLGGWLIVWAVSTSGKIWWTLPASTGFPILGPFIACGFYEISRRLMSGQPLQPAAIFGVIFRQKDRQIPSIAAVIVVFFLFWNFLGHMIFALFLGNAPMTNVSSSLAIFATSQGILMLVVGTMIGAAFATILYSITVVSLPMLLEREVDFATAMITSFNLVRINPLLMLGWGAFIGLSLFLAMLPLFLGLFIALPVLGHASWHLYRAAISFDQAG